MKVSINDRKVVKQVKFTVFCYTKYDTETGTMAPCGREILYPGTGKNTANFRAKLYEYGKDFAIDDWAVAKDVIIMGEKTYTYSMPLSKFIEMADSE